MAYVDSTQAFGNDADGVGVITINVPLHTDGDMLVLIWTVSSGSGFMVDPVGWDVQGGSIGASASDVKCYTRVASSEPASYTLDTGTSSTTGQCAVMLSYSNSSVAVSSYGSFDSSHEASDDKTGAAGTTGAAGVDDITLYQPIYYIRAHDYNALTDGGSATSVTPVAPIVTRQLVEKSDSTPANATRNGMLWVGDAAPLDTLASVEPAWDVAWTWQANPPNFIGVKWTFAQIWFLLSAASPDPGTPGSGGGGDPSSGGAGGNAQGNYQPVAMLNPKRKKVKLPVLPYQLNDQMLRE